MLQVMKILCVSLLHSALADVLTDLVRLKQIVHLPAFDMKIIEDDVISTAAMDKNHAIHAKNVIKQTIEMLETNVLKELAK